MGYKVTWLHGKTSGGLALAVAVALPAFCVHSSPGQSCAPTADGLVGFWRGENSVADFVTGAQGKLVNNATFTEGVVGEAFSFDGDRSGAILDDNIAYHLQDFTIEAWVRRRSPSETSPGPGGGEIFGYGHAGYCLGMENDGSLFLTKVGVDHVMLLKAITDTSFHHVAVTKSGAKVIFFVDGRRYPMPAYHTTFEFSSPPAVGVRGDFLLGSFMGTIDEVALYNRPLITDEIRAIYNAGAAGKCASSPGPVGPRSASVIEAPTLTIARAGESIVLSWPATYTNYYVQGCSDLRTAEWFAIEQSGTVENGANRAITLPIARESRWYRLKSR